MKFNRSKGKFWLGGLDSNQNSQIQNLESYQLDDLPADGRSMYPRKDPGARSNLSRVKRLTHNVNSTKKMDEIRYGPVQLSMIVWRPLSRIEREQSAPRGARSHSNPTGVCHTISCSTRPNVRALRDGHTLATLYSCKGPAVHGSREQRL